MLELLQRGVDAVALLDLRQEGRALGVKSVDLQLQPGQLLLQVGVLRLPDQTRYTLDKPNGTVFKALTIR